MKLFGLALGRQEWELPAVQPTTFSLESEDLHRTNPLYESPPSSPRQPKSLPGESIRSNGLHPIPESADFSAKVVPPSNGSLRYPSEILAKNIGPSAGGPPIIDQDQQLSRTTSQQSLISQKERKYTKVHSLKTRYVPKYGETLPKILDSDPKPNLNVSSLSKTSRFRRELEKFKQLDKENSLPQTSILQSKKKPVVSRHIHDTIESIFSKQSSSPNFSKELKPTEPTRQDLKESRAALPRKTLTSEETLDLNRPSTSREYIPGEILSTTNYYDTTLTRSKKLKHLGSIGDRGPILQSHNKDLGSIKSFKSEFLLREHLVKSAGPQRNMVEQTENALSQSNVRRIAAAIESRARRPSPQEDAQSSGGVTRTDSAESATDDDSRNHTPSVHSKIDLPTSLLHSEDSGITRGDQASTDSRGSDPTSLEKFHKSSLKTSPASTEIFKPDVKDAAVSAKPGKERKKYSKQRASFCNKCGHVRKRGNRSSAAWNTEDYYKSLLRDDPRFLEAARLERFPSLDALPQGYLKRRMSMRSSTRSRQSFIPRVPSLPCMCEQCVTHSELAMHRPSPYDYCHGSLRGNGPMCTCNPNYVCPKRPSFIRKVQFRDKSKSTGEVPSEKTVPKTKVEEEDEELREVERRSNNIFDPEKKFTPSASPIPEPPTILKKTTHPIFTENYSSRTFKNGSLKSPIEEMYRGQPWLLDHWRRYTRRSALRKRRRRAFYMGVMALSLIIFVGVVVSVLLVVLRRKNNTM